MSKYSVSTYKKKYNILSMNVKPNFIHLFDNFINAYFDKSLISTFMEIHEQQCTSFFCCCNERIFLHIIEAEKLMR